MHSELSQLLLDNRDGLSYWSMGKRAALTKLGHYLIRGVGYQQIRSSPATAAGCNVKPQRKFRTDRQRGRGINIL
jgi:hypothetical protein